MTNYGSPRSTKEPARISGNVVIAKVSGEVISVSGIVVIVSSVVIHTEVSGSWVSVSGSTVIAKTSGEVSQISGQAITVSGNWVNVSGATIIASISGQVVYVGESYVIQRDFGSSDSVIVSTMYVAPQPIIVDAANLNLASVPASVSGGVFTVEISTSSAVFPFIRDALDYRTYDYQTAKSICYYPNPALCVASGDIVIVKYENNTFECAESRVEVILRSKV
jgi:hypothetical protein